MQMFNSSCCHYMCLSSMLSYISCAQQSAPLIVSLSLQLPPLPFTRTKGSRKGSIGGFMHAVRPDEAFRAPDREGQARNDPLHTVLVLVMVMVVAAMVVVMVRQEGAREQRLTRDWWWW